MRKRAEKQFKGCFFNGILTFIDGTLLVIVIMAMINLKMYNLDVIERDDSFYLSMIALLICGLQLIIFPICVLIWHRKGTLDSKKNKKRCGALYEDKNYKIRGGWTLLERAS